jgi:hypothetical protein
MAYGRKTGGRTVGTPNKSTIKRHEAMAKVNAALAALGEDTLTGQRLLQGVLRHSDCPLDIRIQVAGLLAKYENPDTEKRQFVVAMPLPLGSGTQAEQLAEWRERYAKELPDATAEDRELHEKLAAQIINKSDKATKSIIPWVDTDVKDEEVN